ncbi:hypothetical protein Sjap_019811 [Stephania japonica]|uniref:Uncharacterized protein n=1 Tax=Stephania japonica TaxID=461633 RepID=A0AAP0F503_9MAGN
MASAMAELTTLTTVTTTTSNYTSYLELSSTTRTQLHDLAIAIAFSLSSSPFSSSLCSLSSSFSIFEEEMRRLRWENDQNTLELISFLSLLHYPLWLIKSVFAAIDAET